MGEPEASTQDADFERYGGCLCGSIRYRLTVEPRVHYCHCDMCRRATGSAFELPHRDAEERW
ncbi:GFA family protein [Mesorhizobium montanum]|uniref:GFA family protein n=1 Tax=Mesorhizobium montanum TaxID=3072323 RepID=UPI003F93C899